MSFNGSGTYSRTNGTNSGSTTWALDAAAGTNILSTRHDTHDEDVATALTNTYCKDGQSTPTANLPMGGYLHSNTGEATARTHYARASQVQDSALVWGGTSGGSANTQTMTLSPAITAYAAGQRFAFKAGYTNTGAATININSLGAKNIRGYDGTGALVGGEIVADAIADIVYDGTQFQLLNHVHAWRAWTPTLSAGGSQTYTSTTINKAKYIQRGKMVTLFLDVTGTTGGTPHTDLTFTLPVTAAATEGMGGAAQVNDSSSYYVGYWGPSSTTVIVVRNSAAANWGAGASRGYRVQFCYEAA